MRSPTSPGPSRAREYAASKVKLEVKLEIAAVAKQLDPVAAVGSTAASAELHRARELGVDPAVVLTQQRGDSGRFRTAFVQLRALRVSFGQLVTVPLFRLGLETGIEAAVGAGS